MRSQLIEQLCTLDWLDRMADRIQNGDILLEEDAAACLRLASLIEQAEAKMQSMNSPESKDARG